MPISRTLSETSSHCAAKMELVPATTIRNAMTRIIDFSLSIAAMSDLFLARTPGVMRGSLRRTRSSIAAHGSARHRPS